MKSVDQSVILETLIFAGGGRVLGEGVGGAEKVQISSPVILRDSLGGHWSDSSSYITAPADTHLYSHLMLSQLSIQYCCRIYKYYNEISHSPDWLLK